jgi:hypothetical protein
MNIFDQEIIKAVWTLRLGSPSPQPSREREQLLAHVLYFKCVTPASALAFLKFTDGASFWRLVAASCAVLRHPASLLNIFFKKRYPDWM